MIKRILSSQTKTITGAAIILAGASFASRLIGFLRDRIFAHLFGAGDILDAYYAAFRVPDLVYNLIVVGALSAGFIPVFTKLTKMKSTEALRVTNSIITILGVGLIVVCGILCIFTPQLMPFIVPGFEGEKLALTVTLTRIMFLSPILLGISGVLSSVLQSFKSFLIYSLTPIMYNIGIIIGALLFVPLFGPKGLALGVVLGAAMHLGIQIPAMRHYKFHYRWTFLWKNKHVREIGKLMIPRTMALATHQVNLVIMTVIASTLAAGSLTVFNFASNIQYFPIGIVGYSFAIAAFPTLAGFVADKNEAALVDHLSRTIRQILFFIIPLTIVFLLLRAQIVRVLFGSGAFGWEATIATADTLAFFTLSLFAQCLIPLLARTFYALHDTWTPFVIAVISTLFNIVLALVFKDIFGIAGLALAFSFAAILQVAMLWISLRTKRLKQMNELSILHFLYKVSIAALFMAFLVQMLKVPIAAVVDMTRFWGIAVQGVVAGGAGLLVYAIIGKLLQLEEVDILQNSLHKKWLKIKHVPSNIPESEEA